MTSVLAAEGGYQVFHMGSTEKWWLLFSGLTALLAIGVGFYLMRLVLAEDQDGEEDEDDGDRLELPFEVRLGALLDRLGDLLHAIRALRLREHPAGQEQPVQHGGSAADERNQDGMVSQ